MQDEDTKYISHDVFISYATDKGDSSTSKDSEVAEKVCSALEAQDIHCWIAPRDILPGDTWLNAIIDAVEKSKVVVLVFSANTNHSQWVRDEVTLALDKNITIIPFRIDDVSPQGGLRILEVRCQWLDAYTPPIEKHVDQLVTVVCQYIGIKPKKTVKRTETIKVKEPPIAVKEKIQEPEEVPGDVKAVRSKAQRVYKNEKGFWEADYGDGIVMVYIPPGEFTMGSNDYGHEKPPHNVYLDSYWIGKYAVTFAQYDKYYQETNPEDEETDDEFWGRGKRPVIYVSWDDANAYCQWLSKKSGVLFKLPTEAQWEKAARGTDQRTFPWGNQEPNKDLANFECRIGKTAPVGTYPKGASPYGILDMAGNVWEWCNDWYGRDYYQNSPGKNPQGTTSGTYRVLRGGCWQYGAYFIRCTARYYTYDSNRDCNFGFRLCQGKDLVE